MQVPLLDLKAQYSTIRAEVEAAIAEVMESQHFILGPKVEECEKAIAQYCGCKHAIGVSSGSDALLACLMAENIGPGDEVLTTPYTFFATVGAIARVGATPVFVDIDPVTYNLDTSQIASKVTSKTRAIIPVHLYGQMTDMDAVMRVADEHGLVVIEDAAQAIGSEHKGRRAGSIGHYGCFSFFPSKNLGSAGDAGMVVTNDAQRAEKLRCLRGHGSKPKYHHKILGGNFRLDAIQAAIVSAKLPYLDRWTAARQRNAKRYDQLIGEAGLPIALPAVTTDRHILNQYVIRIEDRDGLQAHLKKHGVGTEVYYPVPMHLQECFAYLGYAAGAFPESERAAKETLALPIYPELTESQVGFVAECIREYFVRVRPSGNGSDPLATVSVETQARREINSNALHKPTISNLQIVTASEFKKAMGKFASGVTVVTVKVNDITHGMTASAFFSLSLDPPLIAIAVHNRSKLQALLLQATDFGVSILASDQTRLAEHFAGRPLESAGIRFVEIGGVPFIHGALAHIRCSVAARYDGGDHTINTAVVRSVKHLQDCEPLVYFSGNYGSMCSSNGSEATAQFAAAVSQTQGQS